MRIVARLSIVLTAGAVALTTALLPASPAQAAELQPVQNFGSNPGNLQMFHYAPDDVGQNRPLVVALHGCTQSAQDYHANSGWSKIADQWKFHVVYPQTTSANNIRNCFNWFEPGDIARGQGETQSIVQMVSNTVETLGVDPARVYVTGLSAGGAMSSVMLATHPDVFAGGSNVAGIPYQCATNVGVGLQCMNPGINKTPAQWGDLVRNAYPDFQGERPRVAVWHGDADTTVNKINATESTEQWTDVAGVPAEPTETGELPGGTTLSKYGQDAVRQYIVPGMKHGLPVDPGTGEEQCGTAGQFYLDTVCSAYYDATYFGLNS